MIEANRAYAMGDEEQLRAILQAWDRSPEAVQGTDAEAMRLRLVRRIAQIEEQLEGLASALADVKESSLWKLKAMVDDEAAKGKDLIKDMVRRLKRDIVGRHQSPGRDAAASVASLTRVENSRRSR